MISSYSNPLVKRIRRLRLRKHRQAERAFFIEGVRVVKTAVNHNAPLETIVYAPDILTSDVGLEVVAQAQAEGVDCVAVTAKVFGRLSERDNPVGLGAIGRQTWSNLSTWPVTPGCLFVALVGISDPGNLGTILRTMDSVGAAGVLLVGSTTDPFHMTAVKASMGALFTVPITHLPDISALWEWVDEHHLLTISTSAKGSTSYNEIGGTRPSLLIMGSEGTGLKATTLARTEQVVAIPMYGQVSSLNLAVATGILLYKWREGKHD